MEECKEKTPCASPEETLKLWVLDYTTTEEPQYEGMAVVAAYDVSLAERVFLSSSMHNGNPKLLIKKIEQIPYPWSQSLLMEKYVKVF